MTLHQKYWASQHDWYVGTTPNGVLGREYGENGQIIDVEFNCFDALRAWAGY